jgi:hypothetical protein
MTIALRHAAADLFPAIHKRLEATFHRRGRCVVAPGVILARGQAGSVDLGDARTGSLMFRVYPDGSFGIFTDEPGPVTAYLQRLLPPRWSLVRRDHGWLLLGDAGDVDEQVWLPVWERVAIDMLRGGLRRVGKGGWDA